ncbi:OmpA family protein [Acidocella sp.]|uniref:OmpA/MotB family protein n=1 Tax=Acidocella sp. TaxID=50710 RepID=UPI0026162964|nr:OmpA family protein [Acidocella sp.]
MLTPIIINKRATDEAEKPFWISFADLMTALMVLFLVVMSVALLAVTKTVSQQELLKQQRQQDIEKILDEVQQAAKEYPGVTVDRDKDTIDFGNQAQFDMGSYTLTPDQQKLLRAFVPKILTIANDPLGAKWIKQIVVEGFASPEGDYLYNLNLSLQRSQSVLCALFARPLPDETAMSTASLEQIRDLFLVGGYSFNSAIYNASTNSYDQSRRVELRLEFLGLGESRATAPTSIGDNFGTCALGN